MKTLIRLCVACMLCCLQVHAQHSNLSANLMQWLHESPEVSRSRYKADPSGYLSLLVKTGTNVDEKGMQNIGAIVGTKAGSIWTVRVPQNNMRQFVSLAGLDYIELAQKVFIQMDSARFHARVDSVIQGIGLQTPLNGKGVVVGLIDGGFDYTHPAFYDTSYTNLRIRKAWVQGIVGTPPAGYSYGAEYTDSSALLQKKYDFDGAGSHGTHCAAIAAGSGIGSKNRADRGIANESDLVLVSSPLTYLDWREMNMASIIDGINYIFSYAQSVGKPAVISVSMGSQLGARDGGSLFAQACDNLSGAGKILVFAAMNTRLNKCHLSKQFTQTDTVLKSLVPINPIQNNERRNYIEAWGDSLKTFCVQFGMYRNGSVINHSLVYCPDNTIRKFSILGSDNDTCYITLTTKAQDYNKKPHVTIDVFSKSTDTICLMAYANAGEVHFWQEYFDESWYTYWGDFIGNGSWASPGDVNYHIGEMACTKSAITVGAYVSKVFWKDLQLQIFYSQTTGDRQGMLANYSSKGPTLDHRMKPDITAPGGMIYSASNSYDPDCQPNGGSAAFLVSKYTSPHNNRNYYYAAFSGTSMATPVTAGVVALLLQVNPHLQPQEVKAILYKTAIKDNFTTATPDSSLWGAGKLNAYAAVKEAILTAGTIDIPQHPLQIALYPNPNSGAFSITYESVQQGYFLIEVTNTCGQVIHAQSWQLTKGANQLNLDLPDTAEGVLFIRISGNGGAITKRILVQ